MPLSQPIWTNVMHFTLALTKPPSRAYSQNAAAHLPAGTMRILPQFWPHPTGSMYKINFKILFVFK